MAGESSYGRHEDRRAMGLTRDGYRRPDRAVEVRIGAWPGSRDRCAPAQAHARAQWERHALALQRRARGVNRALPRGQVFGGGIDLLFLTGLARHLAACEKCSVVWADGERPVDWLTWAVRQRRAGEVFDALVQQPRRPKRRRKTG